VDIIECTICSGFVEFEERFYFCGMWWDTSCSILVNSPAACALSQLMPLITLVLCMFLYVVYCLFFRNGLSLSLVFQTHACSSVIFDPLILLLACIKLCWPIMCYCNCYCLAT
jgi:hypothetical protein